MNTIQLLKKAFEKMFLKKRRSCMTFEQYYYLIRKRRLRLLLTNDTTFTEEQIEKKRERIGLFDRALNHIYNGHNWTTIYSDTFMLSKDEVCLKYDIDLNTLNIILKYTF
jgi:hypothetical protein